MLQKTIYLGIQTHILDQLPNFQTIFRTVSLTTVFIATDHLGSNRNVSVFLNSIKILKCRISSLRWNFYSPKGPKRFLAWSLFGFFELLCLRSYSLDCFHKNLNLKLSTCFEIFERNFFDFVPCSEILMDQKYQAGNYF